MINQDHDNFFIPYISDEDLKKKANIFLSTYNKNGTLPIPIEYIVEYNLGISIFPTLNLERDWGIDAFINSKLDKIIIDEKSYLRQEERARFSLAHEVAHKILHSEIFKGLGIQDEETYLSFQDNGNLKNKGRMEYQAYYLAGYIMLPQSSFNLRFKELYNSLNLIDVDEWHQIVQILSTEFLVSTSCLQKQIEREFPEIFSSIMKIR